MISETKLDESFPTSQFFMDSFISPHRLDRNCNGGGILLYIREDIPSKLLSIEGDLMEAFFVAINLHNKKKKNAYPVVLITQREFQWQIISQH